jgi:PAS domain S-box-containing protein
MENTSQKASVVLIADHDGARRRLLREAFEAGDLTVIEAPDSESCLLTCKHLRPDLVLLSGDFAGALDISQVIKTSSELQHIRILVQLISDDDKQMNAFFENGVDDCLLPPPRLALTLRRAQALLKEKSLRSEVDFQREILSQMADAVVAVDDNSNVIYWNLEAERVYGIRSEDIIGRPVAKAYQIEGFTPEQRTSVVTTASGQEGWRGEGIHVTHEGERIDVEVSVRALRNNADIAFGHITVIRDISERKRIEAALREERDFSEALHDTVAALTRTLDPEGVMGLILDHLERVVPHTMANIMLLEGDRAMVGYARGYSPETEAELRTQSLVVFDLPTFQQMLTTGQSCLISDTADSSILTPKDKRVWVRSYLGMPISAYDHVIGFLNIDSEIPNTFTQVHAERLHIFADQAAIAIENAQLYDAIYRDAVEMRTLHKATEFLYATNVFASDNLSDMCAQIVQVVVSEFGKVDCGVLLIDEDGKKLERIARSGAFHVDADKMLRIDGDGLVPAVVRTGKLIYAPNVNTDRRYIATNSATQCELAVPLMTAKGVIGVLDLQSAQMNAFDEHDVRLMQVFADRAATALENVRLYSEIRRHAERLEERVQERTGELNRVKERVEAILNHSSDAILLVRTTGAITQTNRSFDMMFGYVDDQAFGRPLLLVAEPSYQTAMKQALERVLEKKNPERLEIVAQRSNRLTFDADVTLSPVVSATQQITSVVCSLRDISARKRLETELREALQKERELSDLKSRFIARASHEFRTPLAVILTSSDLLKSYGNRMSEEQREEKLNRLQKEVRGIAVMLDDLLTISKGEELNEFNPELLDLQNLVRDTVQGMRDGTGGQHDLNVECQGNCTSVYADRKLVTRIVTNLVSNAIKYSPSGSKIEVYVTCETSRLVLEVQDHGIGIPAEDQARLFEAFHRARNVDHISGTGLGLAIVKQAVDLHGGSVSVKSQLGEGTVFTVVLPNLAVREKLP